MLNFIMIKNRSKLEWNGEYGYQVYIKIIQEENKMKVVTAIDSFKGSMTSMEAGFAAAEGIHRVDADAEVQVRPLADGGEGTVEALVAGMNGKTEYVKVTGPLGEPVICEYGIIESTKTAVIEMAGAAGITQVPDEKRNSGTSLRTVPHKRTGELLPSPYFRWTAAKSRPCPNDGSRAKVFIVR